MASSVRSRAGQAVDAGFFVSVAHALHLNARTRSATAAALALVFSIISVPGALQALTISEINYRPDAETDPDETLEFIELCNEIAYPIDLSGYSFTDGIRYTFPEGVMMRGRSYLVLCRSSARVREVYGIENVIGDYEGRLDNGGERLRIVDRRGGEVTDVRYRPAVQWPGTAHGTGFTLALKNVAADPDSARAWVRSLERGGTPGTINFREPLPVRNDVIPETGAGAEWRFRTGWDSETLVMAEFSDPLDAWRSPEFDDSEWRVGITPIGMGDEDIVTVLDDMLGNYLAFAARKSFTLAPESLEEAVFVRFELRFDDGFVAYLNGEEIGRNNVPGEPGEDVPADARATRFRESDDDPIVFELAKEKILPGENVLAIQIHNNNLQRSSDASLIPSLHFQTVDTFPGPPTERIVINEVVRTTEDSSGAIELLNLTPERIDLSGFQISRSADPAVERFEIPDGTTLADFELLVFTEAELGFSLGASSSLELFLYDRGGVAVETAALFDPLDDVSRGTSHVRYPDGNAGWRLSSRPTPAASNDLDVETGVVFSEIHYHPRTLDDNGERLPEGEAGEYVELYNRSASPINLEGMAIDDGYNYTFAPGQVLAPGAYLVVAKDPSYVRALYGLSAEQVVGLRGDASLDEREAFGTLSNRGERLRLVDHLGRTIDEVTYFDGGEWPAAADGGGSSIELIDPLQDNSVASAWAPSDESAAAPWTEFDYEIENVVLTGPGLIEAELHLFFLDDGECLIDGVSITAGEPAVEYIENGSFEVDTRPWRIMGNHIESFRTTEEASDGNASLRLIATGAGNNKVNRIEIDTTESIPAGPIRVRFKARWLTGSNALHVSGHNNAFGRTVYLAAPRTNGSPGRENGATRWLRETTGDSNLGPVVASLRHAPAVPAPGQSVQLLARVTDSDGVEAVTAYYRVDRMANRAEEGAEVALGEGSIALHDDGLHGDGLPGDGTYGGAIGPFQRGDVISFWVEAVDGLEAQREFPIGAPLRARTFAVDLRTVGNPLSRFRLVMNDLDLTELETRALHSNALLPATLVLEEEEVFYDVGVRYRGSPWGRPSVPKQFRLRFPGDRTLPDGAKRVNLSSRGSGQREGMAYYMVREAGTIDAPTPFSQRFQYIDVKLNGEQHSSPVMAEIRPVDSIYARHHWPHDGDGLLWKITGKIAFNDAGTMSDRPFWTEFRTLREGPFPGVDSAENYRFFYNPKLRRDEDSFEPLIRLLTAMDSRTTPDEEYVEKIESILNVESTLRVFVARILHDDWDTIDIGNGQNAYLYYAPNEGRHYLLPWDMDNSFGSTTARLLPTSTTFGLGRLARFPEYRRLYFRLLQEHLDERFNRDRVEQWTDLVHAVGRPAPTGGPIVSFVSGRRAYVLGTALRHIADTEFAIVSPNPSGTRSGVVLLRGTAPLNVQRILVSVNSGDPQETSPTWSVPADQDRNTFVGGVPVEWTFEIAGLVDSDNEIRLAAFDHEDNLVGTALARVFDTTTWPDPTLTAIDPISGPLGGGTRMTLFGAGFREGTWVEVGGSVAEETVILSETQLEAVVPLGAEEGVVDVAAFIADGRSAVLADAFTYTLNGFRRGDADGDGRVIVDDVFAILNFLFRGGEASCEDAVDTNDDGRLNISDAIRLLLHLFGGGLPPAPPFEQPGLDRSEDSLKCEV